MRRKAQHRLPSRLLVLRRPRQRPSRRTQAREPTINRARSPRPWRGVWRATPASTSPHLRHRSARPRRRARRRGGAVGRDGAESAAPRLARAPRRCAQAPSDDKIRALFEPGSYEVVPHDDMRKTIARAPGAGEADDPAFLPHRRLRRSTSCWRRARTSTPPRPRAPTASRPASSRSTTSSSRRWRWR